MKSLLLILDGLGIADGEHGNAITPHSMPYLHKLMARNGHARLEASGPTVGLDVGQPGNSEIGHITIGAGRRIKAKLEQIRDGWDNGDWAASPVWQEVDGTSPLHVVGLLSDAGIHGDLGTIVRAAKLASERGVTKIWVHVLLDGVDAKRGSAARLLASLHSQLAVIDNAALASVMGRRWALDRSGDMEVTRQYSQFLFAMDAAPSFEEEGLAAHLEQLSESMFPGRVIDPRGRVRNGEAVLLTNHRADRTVQLARVLSERQRLYAMTSLADAVEPSRVFFPDEPITGGVAEWMTKLGVRNVRIAESSKFPHVTYFMNGRKETFGEKTICIPSPPDHLLAELPQMSIAKLAETIIDELDRPGNQAVIANVANLDQIGHLGDLNLARQAAEIVDAYLKYLVERAGSLGWNVVITADHGNADQMMDPDGSPRGSHSTNPVPLLFVASSEEKRHLRLNSTNGTLANVAATFFTSLGIGSPLNWQASLLGEAEAVASTQAIS